MSTNKKDSIATVVLLSGDAEKRSSFEELLGADPMLEVASFGVAKFSDFDSAIARDIGTENSPLVVVVADDIASADALSICREIDQLRPDGSVIWIASGQNPDAIGAMRAGVRAILEGPVDPRKLKASVVENAHQAQKRWQSVVANAVSAQAVDHRGSVITVISPKGGVGKTTVSTNIAVGLAKKTPNQVVLLDLDVQFGDVASALGLTPTHTLLDVLKGPAKTDLLVLKSFITEHESGLRVIPAPLAPEEASQISAEEITQLLNTLVNQFEYVVVDTSPGFSDLTLAALEKSSDTVIVSELDVPSLRGVRKALDVMIALNLVGNTRKIVLNNMGRIAGLKISDARKLLSEPIAAEIPSSSKVMFSTNEGVPVLQKARNGKAIRELQGLVDGLVKKPRNSAYAPTKGMVA